MAEAEELKFRVGTYRKNGGDGLTALCFLPDEQRLVVGTADQAIANASFGVSGSRGVHYFVDEEAATIGAYRGGAGALESLGSTPSGGGQPCYLALDATERWLACANYGSGSLALFRIASDGALSERRFLHQNVGGSLDPDRQEGPHVHCTLFSPDQRWLHAVDLGIDRILSFPFDPNSGITGDPIIAWAALPGCGPRHLLFHPRLPIAYLVSELSSTLTILECSTDGSFIAREVMTTVPPGARGRNLGGHLTIDAVGRRLYVTNRGHDSIASFALDEEGNASWLDHVDSGGASPRHLLLVEEAGLALVANEEGGTVCAFRIEIDGLTPIDGATAELPGAAFILRTPQ